MVTDAPPPDSQPTPATDIVEGSIDENVLTYRAVHPLAIVSLILGILSVFCFVSPYFLAVALLAVICGGFALRAIHRQSDQFVGGGFCRVGLTLALVCAGASVTISSMQDYLLRSEMRKFLRAYEVVLKEGSLADVVFYRTFPPVRFGFTHAGLLEDYQTPRENADTERINEIVSSVRVIRERVQGRVKGRDPDPLRFVKLLSAEYDTKSQVANAIGLYQFDGGADYSPHINNKVQAMPDLDGLSKPEGYEYVLVVLRGLPRSKFLTEDLSNEESGYSFLWYIDNLRYPYTPEGLAASAIEGGDGD